MKTRLSIRDVEKLENTSHVAALCGNLANFADANTSPINVGAAGAQVGSVSLWDCCGHTACSHTACSHTGASEAVFADQVLGDAQAGNVGVTVTAPGSRPVTVEVPVDPVLDTLARQLSTVSSAARNTLEATVGPLLRTTVPVVGTSAGEAVRATVADASLNECARSANDPLAWSS